MSCHVQVQQQKMRIWLQPHICPWTVPRNCQLSIESPGIRRPVRRWTTLFRSPTCLIYAARWQKPSRTRIERIHSAELLCGINRVFFFSYSHTQHGCCCCSDEQLPFLPAIQPKYNFITATVGFPKPSSMFLQQCLRSSAQLAKTIQAHCSAKIPLGTAAATKQRRIGANEWVKTAQDANARCPQCKQMASGVMQISLLRRRPTARTASAESESGADASLENGTENDPSTRIRTGAVHMSIRRASEFWGAHCRVAAASRRADRAESNLRSLRRVCWPSTAWTQYLTSVEPRDATY